VWRVPADPNIRVACLTCLGCVVSTPSPLLEVSQIIEPLRPSHRVSENSSTHQSSLLAEPDGANRPPDWLSPSPTIVTPVLSGTQTPLSEGLGSSDGGTVPGTTSWMVRLCIRCVSPQLSVDTDGTRQPLSASQPLPVRLEALQLLTLLTKGYFMIVRYIFYWCGILDTVYRDHTSVVSVKCHRIDYLMYLFSDETEN